MKKFILLLVAIATLVPVVCLAKAPSNSTNNQKYAYVSIYPCELRDNSLKAIIVDSIIPCIKKNCNKPASQTHNYIVEWNSTAPLDFVHFSYPTDAVSDSFFLRCKKFKRVYYTDLEEYRIYILLPDPEKYVSPAKGTVIQKRINIDKRPLIGTDDSSVEFRIADPLGHAYIHHIFPGQDWDYPSDWKSRKSWR